GAKRALWMRHRDGDAAVLVTEGGNSKWRAVRVERIGGRHAAIVVHVAEAYEPARGASLRRREVRELRTAFAMRHRHRQERSGHVVQQHRRAAHDLHESVAGLVLLTAITHEPRPVIRARNDA